MTNSRLSPIEDSYFRQAWSAMLSYQNVNAEDLRYGMSAMGVDLDQEQEKQRKQSFDHVCGVACGER